MKLTEYIRKIRADFFNKWVRMNEDQRAYILLAVEDHGDEGDNNPGAACTCLEGNNDLLVGLLEQAAEQNEDIRKIICRAASLIKNNQKH